MQPNLKAPRGARRARRRATAERADHRRVSGSTKRTRESEPVALLARETHTSWFERVRTSSSDSGGPPSGERFFEFSDPKIVVQAAGEQPPAVAGALAGALGGVIGLSVFSIFAPMESSVLELLDRLGVAFSLGVLGAPLAGMLGVLCLFAACTGVGLAFGVLARRLRKPLPLFALAVVSAFGAALSLRCVLLERMAPGIARSLPIGPTLLAACAFGAVLATELPIRRMGAASTRRASPGAPLGAMMRCRRETERRQREGDRPAHRGRAPPGDSMTEATESQRRRKDEILDVATELFAARGYEGVSMNDVAERVGMRKASLFYHYASKDALYEASLERLIASLQSPLEAIYSSGGTFAERLEALTSTLVVAHGERPWAARILVREAMDWGPVMRGKLHERILLALEAGAAWLRAGQEEGVCVEGDPKHVVLSAIGFHLLPFVLGQLVERYTGTAPFDPVFIEKRRTELVRQARNLHLRKRR